MIDLFLGVRHFNPLLDLRHDLEVVQVVKSEKPTEKSVSMHAHLYTRWCCHKTVGESPLDNI